MELIPLLTIQQDWAELLEKPGRQMLEQILPGYLLLRRWFGSKARRITSAGLRAVFAIPCARSTAFLTVVQVEFSEGHAENYVLPLAFATGDRADALLKDLPHAVVARLDGRQRGVLFDALADPDFATALLDAVGDNQAFQGEAMQMRGRPFTPFAVLRGPKEQPLAPSIGKAEQSNTSIVFGQRLILKMFRRLEEGTNPELEIGRYLSEVAGYPHVAPLAGAIELHPDHGREPWTLAVVQAFVPNQGDAWQFTLDALGRFYKSAAGSSEPVHEPAGPEAAAYTRDQIGDYLNRAALLGRRTAELHLALAANREDPAFAPEPFDDACQQGLCDSLAHAHDRVADQLRQRLGDLTDEARALAEPVLNLPGGIPPHLQAGLRKKIAAQRTRCHGDYHLGQVLVNGADFLIIDFEGEPARSLAERRRKESPLKDVAGMIRSFHYAAHCGMPPGKALTARARFWYASVRAAFLKSYWETAATGSFLPQEPAERKLLLDIYLWEKAIYELAYELNHRPDWVRIPLLGIRDLLE